MAMRSLAAATAAASAVAAATGLRAAHLLVGFLLVSSEQFIQLAFVSTSSAEVKFEPGIKLVIWGGLVAAAAAAALISG